MVHFLSTRLPDLAAGVPFYGNHPAVEDAAKVKAPLLIHFAAVDERINAAWPAYEAALKAAGARYTAHQYPGTQHGFNNDTTPRLMPRRPSWPGTARWRFSTRPARLTHAGPRLTRRAAALRIALASGIWQGAAPARAQSFPTRPVRILVPFGPGGVADLTARAVGQKLAESLGQPVVVENRPGAGGIAAGEAVAKAEPDGHTLLLMSNGTAVSAGLFRSLPFDPLRDFAPVGLLATFEIAILVAAEPAGARWANCWPTRAPTRGG
jgi:hypothetical protein